MKRILTLGLALLMLILAGCSTEVGPCHGSHPRERYMPLAVSDALRAPSW